MAESNITEPKYDGLGIDDVAENEHVLVHWRQSGGPDGSSSAAQDSSKTSSSSTLSWSTAHNHSDAPLIDDDISGNDDDDDELLSPAPPRERLSYTRYQLELLNGIYLSVRYPNSVQKQLIAKRVGISREQVKIWFQNRRRKDVVKKKIEPDENKSSTSEPTSPSASNSSTSSPKSKDINTDICQYIIIRTCPTGSEETDGSQKIKMVPDAVINGCISELKRFSDEKLKERKEKRKAKGKRKNQTVASLFRSVVAAATPICSRIPNSIAYPSKQSGNRLFIPYDMVSPPNKVTPTAAFLNTTANRFNHSRNSSAFSSPREQFSNPSAMHRSDFVNTNSEMLGQPFNNNIASVFIPSHNFCNIDPKRTYVQSTRNISDNPESFGSQDNLPVLSDLLSYRPRIRNASDSLSLRKNPDVMPFSVPFHSHHNSTISNTSTMLLSESLKDGYVATSRNIYGQEISRHSSDLALGRVFPYPFTADPPIMLSSLHHQPIGLIDHAQLWARPQMFPARQTESTTSHLYNTMSSISRLDPYKPVVISSLGNPFYSVRPPISHTTTWTSVEETTTSGTGDFC